MGPRLVTAADVVQVLRGHVEHVVGPTDRMVERPGPLGDDASPTTLTFCTREGEEGLALLSSTKAGVVLCRASALPPQANRMATTFVVVHDPRLAFARALEALFSPPRPTGVHPTAVVAKSARFGADCYLGPHVSIGEGVVLGDRCVLHAGVRVHDGSRLGNEVTVHANTTIGSDGFGYARDADQIQKFPQLGSVVIGDRVEIGANTAIDRGALRDTTIADDCKIDNLVHIAHNVRLGRGCLVVAHAMVGGSVVAGEGVWFGPGCQVSDNLRIGDRAYITLGAVVTRDVSANERVSGNFAIPHERFLAFLRTIR